jgi:hypothetical protein
MLHERSRRQPGPGEVVNLRRCSREYKRSVETVGASVWAIHPQALATIVGIIGERANGTGRRRRRSGAHRFDAVRRGCASTDGGPSRWCRSRDDRSARGP